MALFAHGVSIHGRFTSRPCTDSRWRPVTTRWDHHALDAESATDQQVALLKNGRDAAERVSQAAVVREYPALTQRTGHPVEADILVVAVLLVSRVK